MKVLNLYSGIGGNRKLWEDVDVTAVEIDEPTAEVYKSHFPNDKVIIADAHEYLLNHYKEYDFIWSSPPCPTHSVLNRANLGLHPSRIKYADMNLYQEIILLKHYANCKWIVENVTSYYEPLIPPSAEIHRHYYWSNFNIKGININDTRKHKEIISKSKLYGFDISKTGVKDKRKALRNMVNPELGKHILNTAMNVIVSEDVEQNKLFT